jgi:hypothetical protein
MAADQANDTFIQSRQPAKNGYGQNGFLGASSDLPGKHTTSGFLPQVALPKTDGNWQTRKVDAAPITVHSGMAAPGASLKIVDHIHRKG